MKAYRLIGSVEIWSLPSGGDKKSDEIFLTQKFSSDTEAKRYIEKLLFEKIREYETQGFQCRILSQQVVPV